MKKYYYCKDCESFFDEDEARVVYENPNRLNNYDQYEGYGYIACPSCKSFEITNDVEPCFRCGEPVLEDNVCENCTRDLLKDFAKFCKEESQWNDRDYDPNTIVEFIENKVGDINKYVDWKKISILG